MALLGSQANFLNFCSSDKYQEVVQLETWTQLDGGVICNLMNRRAGAVVGV